MAKVEPTTGEETLAFQLVDLPVSKNAPVYQTGFWIDKRFDLHPDTPSVFTFPRRALQDCALDPLFHHSSPSPLPPRPRLQLLFSPALARSRDESREVPRPWGSSSRPDSQTGRGRHSHC